MTESKRLLLIDGNSVAFRAFFALYTSLNSFTNADGLHTNAIFGFNKMLDIMLAQVKPTDALVAFDAGKVTFRTKKNMPTIRVAVQKHRQSFQNKCRRFADY